MALKQVEESLRFAFKKDSHGLLAC